jgi:CTD small phosphatase-like protein 2
VIPGKEGKKTIIFDLDETLVHICDMSSASQINLKIWLNFVDSMNYGVLLRPYTMQCLHKAKDLFEIILFTASEEKYARAIINYLDPDHCIFDHCFFKQACINVNGFWVKDLRIFMNRQLKNMIIVDNFMPSYLFQLENGIPVTTWTGEFYDKKLLHVIEMMDVLSQAHDVREVIRKTYGLKSQFSGIRF